MDKDKKKKKNSKNYDMTIFLESNSSYSFLQPLKRK